MVVKFDGSFFYSNEEGVLAQFCSTCVILSFFCTCNTVLQNSACSISIGCLSHLVNSLLESGPHTSLPYRAIGSITDWNILSQILDWNLDYNVPFNGIECSSCFVSQLVHSHVKATCVADI